MPRWEEHCVTTNERQSQFLLQDSARTHPTQPRPSMPSQHRPNDIHRVHMSWWGVHLVCRMCGQPHVCACGAAASHALCAVEQVCWRMARGHGRLQQLDYRTQKNTHTHAHTHTIWSCAPATSKCHGKRSIALSTVSIATAAANQISPWCNWSQACSNLDRKKLKNISVPQPSIPDPSLSEPRSWRKTTCGSWLACGVVVPALARLPK